MNKLGILLLALFLVLGISSVKACYCGEIELTDASGNPVSDYLVGTNVYLNETGFEGSYYHYYPCTWNLTRDNSTVASGTIKTDIHGNVAPTLVYTAATDDLGKDMKFKLSCYSCTKEKHFIVHTNDVPEFGTAAALIALVGSVAVFMVIRKRH
jgi:hypothetical protein